MQKEHEDRNFEESGGKKPRIRARQKPADFMRVEDIGTMPGLTPFELETKKEMAKLSQTPLDDLVSREDQDGKLKAKKIGKRRINTLIRRGALTRRQRLVYELCYVSKLPDTQVADLLGVSRVTVRRIRQNIRDAFLQQLERQKKRELLIKRAFSLRLNQKQKEVFMLYCRHGLTVKEIAARCGITIWSAYHVLHRIQKKIFPA